MHIGIIKNYYFYREEIIVKLTEIFINTEKLITNFTISNNILSIIDYI